MIWLVRLLSVEKRNNFIGMLCSSSSAVLVNAILILRVGIGYWFYSDTKCALWSNLVPRLHVGEPCGPNCGFISLAYKKLRALPQIRSNKEEKACSFLCMWKRMEY